MQALSMIDMGTQVPEIHTPSKSMEAQDKPFGKVLNDQRQPERVEQRKAETSEKPMAQKTATEPSGNSTEQKAATDTETQPKGIAKIVQQMVAEMPEQQVGPVQVQAEQGKVQHLIIDLLQTLVTESDPQLSAQQGEELAPTEELLTQLVQQLDSGELKGEQVLAGIDLTPLVEQLQEFSEQQKNGDSLEQLVAQLAEQLASETGLKANSELVVGMVEQPVQQIFAGTLDSLGKARQVLQQAIDAVAGQKPVVTAEGEMATQLTDDQPEDAQLLFDQPAEEEIDPRFAGLLKPRNEGFDVQSLRERFQGQVTTRQTAQATPAAEQRVVAAEVNPEQGKVEIADLFNPEPKQAVDNLLRQVQGTQQQGLQPNQELNNVKQMPLETRMLQLPSGQQVAESQVFDQVVARMSGSFNGESGRMVLRIQPAELGSLKLELIVEGDRVRANLQAQSLQVQEVLERNLPQLRNALAEQGLKIDQFQVNVDQHNEQQSQFDNLAQQQHRQESRQQKAWQQGWPEEEQIIPLSHLLQNGGGGISLHV